MSPAFKSRRRLPRRAWGFRCTRADLFVIVLAVLSAVSLCSLLPALSLLVFFVIVHFFLFCNVFRVGEALELVWSGVFVASVAAGVTLGLAWWIVLALPFGCTLLVIARSLKSPDYHGIGCQRVNPLGYRPEARLQQRKPISDLLRLCGTPQRIVQRLRRTPGEDH